MTGRLLSSDGNQSREGGRPAIDGHIAVFTHAILAQRFTSRRGPLYLGFNLGPCLGEVCAVACSSLILLIMSLDGGLGTRHECPYRFCSKHLPDSLELIIFPISRGSNWESLPV